MGVIDTYNLEQLVNIVLPPEEADGFLGSFHRGSFAKAVCGDEHTFVDPTGLEGEELERARQYFIKAYYRREMPRPNP